MRLFIIATLLAVNLTACGHRTALKLPQEKGKPPVTAPDLRESERP